MKNKKIVVSVLGILGIILTTIGVTYAFFSYSKTGTKENKISSGKVTFLYTEASQGITLTDAMPMTDAEGKAQTGEGKVFDFRVTSSVGSNMRIPYTVTVKPASSVIPAEYIKLYLTDQSDNEIEPVRTLASLDNYSNTITGLTGEKVLYEGEVQAGNSNYNKLFRLRMWIADNIDMNESNTGIGTYNGASFSLKVNVYGEGATTTQTEAERRANASIESVTVDGSNVTVVDSTHYTSEVLISQNEESIQVPIVVDTVNDNATVKVERVNNQSSNINESKVKKIAVTKNVTVYPGTNQFKITVTPEDKSDPTIYYLTVTTVSSYSITYNLNGGTQESNAVTSYVPTTSITLPKPAKANYLFEGWYEDPNFNGSGVTQIAQGTTGNKIYYAKWGNIPEPSSFETDDWVTIMKAINNSNNYELLTVYPVGATRTVTLKNNLGTHTLRIANKTACTNGETSETACGFVIEFADIIEQKQMDEDKTTNTGGYPAMSLHNYVNVNIFNALPDEIKNSIINTTVVSSHGASDICNNCPGRDSKSNFVLENQKLYLLDQREVFDYSGQRNTASGQTRQLDYYSSLTDNPQLWIKQITTNGINSNGMWWLRTILNNTDKYIGLVTSSGAWNDTFPNYYDVRLGISPAFRIGTATVDSNN